MHSHNKRHRKVRKCLAGPNFSGQHLMHNQETIKEMLNQAKLLPGETVLDIGAGKGAITFPLAGKVKKVIAIETDPEFVKILRKKSEEYPQVAIVQQDFMQMKLPAYPFCVVANIPYSITTPILERLLSSPVSGFGRGVLIMEYGAAKRFTAETMVDPRILGWRMWFDLALVRKVPRTHFSPPPRVDSAIVSITRKTNPSVPPNQQIRFSALAAYALQQPQLTVYEALKGVFTAVQLKHVVKCSGVDRHQTIASLNVEQWAVVFNAMIRHVESFRWPRIRKKARK